MTILAYLWFRFGNWTFGLAAVLCLIHDLCFTLGCIAVCHYLHDIPVIGSVFKIQDFKIDLAAVAALLTLVGYSVNDTIVVFDRIREVRGKNPALTPQMINDSVNQTLSRTVLASTTVLLVVIVLYFFGGRRSPVRVRDGDRRDRRNVQFDLRRQSAAADLRRRDGSGVEASGEAGGGNRSGSANGTVIGVKYDLLYARRQTRRVFSLFP